MRARRQLAELYYARGEFPLALEAYQELFVAGDETPDLRARLVELHFRAGNTTRGSDHLSGLRRLAGWTPRDAVPEAREFFRRMLDLDETNPAYTGWLVEDARTRGEATELGALLNVHCTRLENAQTWQEAREAAEVVVQLQPTNEAAVRRLARLERRCDRPARAVAVLQGLLERMAATTSDPDKLRPVIEEILELDPLSGIARKVYRERVTGAAQDPRLELEENLIELIAGRFDWIGALESRSRASTLDRCVAFLAAALARWRGQTTEAAAALGWCADAALRAGDRGQLAEIVEMLAAIDAASPDLAKWQLALAAAPNEAAIAPATASALSASPSEPVLAPAPEHDAKTEVIAPSRVRQPARSPARAGQAASKGVATTSSAASTADGQAQRPFTEGEGAEVKVNNQGIMSSLARLKNLKGASQSSASTSAPNKAAADPPPQIGSAASRLSALRKKPPTP